MLEDELSAVIKEKDRRFQAYLENTREAIWRIDLRPPLSKNTPTRQMVECVFHNTIITEANDAMAQMYGMAEGREIIGRPLIDFMSPADQANVRAVHELVHEKFLVQDVITHEGKADGTIGIFLNNTTPRYKNGILIYFWGSSLEITEICTLQEDLKKTHWELEEQKLALEEKNMALKELISQISIEKENLKDRIMQNLEHVILPALDKIKATNGDVRYIDLLHQDLLDLTSSFGRTLAYSREKLTPREIEVCRLVKNGLTNKEIAGILHLSRHTIEKHRRMVRKKLGINNKRINLQTYLSSRSPVFQHGKTYSRHEDS